jgi:hypothetical protein
MKKFQSGKKAYQNKRLKKLCLEDLARKEIQSELLSLAASDEFCSSPDIPEEKNPWRRSVA